MFAWFFSQIYENCLEQTRWYCFRWDVRFWGIQMTFDISKKCSWRILDSAVFAISSSFWSSIFIAISCVSSRWLVFYAVHHPLRIHGLVLFKIISNLDVFLNLLNYIEITIISDIGVKFDTQKWFTINHSKKGNAYFINNMHISRLSWLV